MSNNPYSPDYAPPYSGPDRRGPVGHGSDFGVHLYALYNAGRVQFPTYADRVYDASVGAARIEGQMQDVLTATGNPPALQALLTLRQELEDALFTTSRVMIRVGEALVSIADEYVRTDHDAHAAFKALYPQDQTAYDNTGKPALPTSTTVVGPIGLPPAYPRAE